MKIIIKSYYNYNYSGEFNSPDQFDDYLEEELNNATIIQNDNQIKIEHEQGYILIEENKITQKRNDNLMVIEAGTTTICKYKTEHGIIDLTIDGLSVERYDEGEIISRAIYLMNANGAEPYKVEIEIIKA